jgi:two-component system response regulator FixJ
MTNMTEQQPTIFVVEDDLETRNATELLLSVSGFTTTCFESAESLLDSSESLTHLAASHCVCVLADLRLPGLNGLQLFQRLRNDGIAVPVILISGHADVETIQQAIDAGVNEFILKPVRPADLIATLRSATQHEPPH